MTLIELYKSGAITPREFVESAWERVVGKWTGSDHVCFSVELPVIWSDTEEDAWAAAAEFTEQRLAAASRPRKDYQHHNRNSSVDCAVKETRWN